MIKRIKSIIQSNRLFGCFVCFGCFAFITSCITILPPPLKDDGYINYVQEVKNDTVKATENLLSTFLSVDDGKIYEVDNLFIDSMCNKHEKLWVIMWAVWCPHCILNLEDEIKYAKTNNLKVVLVSSNYDIEHIKKWYEKYSYKGNIYIIKSSVYSNNESEKIMKFSNQLYKADNNISSLPQSFYYKNGKLVYSVSGDKVDYSHIK